VGGWLEEEREGGEGKEGEKGEREERRRKEETKKRGDEASILQSLPSKIKQQTFVPRSSGYLSRGGMARSFVSFGQSVALVSRMGERAEQASTRASERRKK